MLEEKIVGYALGFLVETDFETIVAALHSILCHKPIEEIRAKCENLADMGARAQVRGISWVSSRLIICLRH